MSTQAELIQLGKRWIEHAPPAKPTAAGLRGFTGPAGFICAACCSRITGRGCHLATLATDPVWLPGVESCVLCEPSKKAVDRATAIAREASKNDAINCGTYSA